MREGLFNIHSQHTKSEARIRLFRSPTSKVNVKTRTQSNALRLVKLGMVWRTSPRNWCKIPFLVPGSVPVGSFER